jgi:nucleotide-binding universal stress UspA family protein
MSPSIVVGIDGSSDSLGAYRLALDEARHRGTGVVALFAWQLPLVGIPGAFDRDHLEAQARSFLNSQLDELSDGHDVAVERVVAQGDPSASLIEACRRTGAELLVLGSRGRGGFGGLLLGSVSNECASHAPCPVLIFR